MKGTTHLAVGACAALLLADQGVAAAAGLIAGSVLPDIDSSDSLVGRHLPIIPLLLPHRTITHSLLIAAAAWFISPYLSLGMLSHIMLDMLTPAGVSLLWPWGERIRVPVIHHLIPSGGLIDYGLGAVLGLVDVYLLWNLISGTPVTLPGLA